MADIRSLALGAISKVVEARGWQVSHHVREELADAVTAAVAPALADGEREAAELSRRIGDLRAFERAYRSNLLAYFENQARELRGEPTRND